ncbi:Beta-barrel porin 2 [Vibrio crassostreae]|nr:Beta-barrel porin 2 [Vibrio crassostreae]
MSRRIVSTSLLTSFLAYSAQAEEQNECHSQPLEDAPVEKAYHFLNSKFCQPALWFDSFFVDDRITEDARAGTSVRWYNDFIYSEGGDVDYSTKLKARLHLPFVSKRLKLIYESVSDEEFLDFFPNDSDELESALGLRYDAYAKGYSSFNIKATLRPRIEARYRFTYPLTTDVVFRLTQRIYQEKQETGEITDIDFDLSLSDKFLARWSSFTGYNDDLKGWTYGTGLSLYHYLSQDQALQYSATINATDEPYNHYEYAQVSITYR